jgi:hypothetical protein
MLAFYRIPIFHKRFPSSIQISGTQPKGMRIPIRREREGPIFLISRAVKNLQEKLLPYPYVGSAELLEPLVGLHSQLTRGNNH